VGAAYPSCARTACLTWRMASRTRPRPRWPTLASRPGSRWPGARPCSPGRPCSCWARRGRRLGGRTGRVAARCRSGRRGHS
jgi:hypothetical protein